jgi:uncharacterized protein HemX
MRGTKAMHGKAHGESSRQEPQAYSESRKASGPLWALASGLVLAICLAASGIDGTKQQCYESASASDLRNGIVDCKQ